MQKALFLDRDGVVNVERGTFTWRIADFQFMPGIFDLCRAALAKGYKLAVVTNQSGIARGLYGHAEVEQLHHYLLQEMSRRDIELDQILYCPHHQDFTGRCFCRKPGSLLLERAAALLRADPRQSFMLGDKARDLIAGRALGCRTVYIGESEGIEADFHFSQPDQLIPFL
jgi:D-glycero-D-manno-heptose 1,7-bisphosphate phosphatase